MSKPAGSKGKKLAAAFYTLELNKREAKNVLDLFGAIELKMFEKGFAPTEGQMKLVRTIRKNLSQQINGEAEASIEEQLAAAVEWAQEAKRKRNEAKPNHVVSIQQTRTTASKIQANK